jgi:hypothetical protein
MVHVMARSKLLKLIASMMRKVVIALILSPIVFDVRASETTRNNSAQTGVDVSSMKHQAKRRAPVPVAPVVFAGVRYEAAPWARIKGLDQTGGIVTAFDDKSGAELWKMAVYKISYNADKEADVQDVFITSLRLSSDGKELEVTDELERHFTIDLSSRTITQVK